jgi:ribosomal protein S18 acetylase RimI-like enzyme
MLSSIQKTTIRPATEEDRQQLANLIHFEAHVHRHLDWRPPLDWVGYHPYLTIERNGKFLAALACPPDPPNVAWVRLFAVSSGLSVGKAWEQLWGAARESLLDTHPHELIAAAIPLQGWFRTLLEKSDFTLTHRVVVLAWRRGETPPAVKTGGFVIRPMNFDDLNAVEAVDASSFSLVWQNSRPCLEMAYQQAAIATVAEGPDGLVGYQISTAGPMGGHLARLAVQPEYQGQGIGSSLLRDLLVQFNRRGVQSVTVNTQHDNQASMALYEKVGFRRTGEDYPVYQSDLR